ncbi:MAG: hypothetical protein L3J58_03215 [Emcibacter sp.]|nr:hypothetical protein [Emcibacter sp.]
MKNVKNVKGVSRLTGSLLAKKGNAAPSPASLSMNQAVLDRFPAPEYGRSTSAPVLGPDSRDNDSLESAIGAVKEISTRQNGPTSKDKSGENLNISKESVPDDVASNHGKKTSGKAVGMKRIAMTLRMEPENHLRLRILSAHTRKSCQAILSEALDLYFMENEEQIPLKEIASQNR